MLLISIRCLVILHICAKFREIILNRIKVIERTRFLYGKLQRGNDSFENYKGGVTVVYLCMLSGYVLYFYQVL